MANDQGCNRLKHHEREYSAPSLSGIEWRFLDRSLEKSCKNYNRTLSGSIKTYLGTFIIKKFHYKHKESLFQGNLVAVKRLAKKSVDLTRTVLMELKQVLRD